MELDFSFLENITPYKNDKREIIDTSKVDEEIANLSKEIEGISLDKVPFDKWDYIIMFVSAVLEVGADFILGNPNKGLSKSMSDKNTKLGGYFNDIHSQLDHGGQPLDFQGKFDGNGTQLFSGMKNETGKNTISFGGGGHRSRTFGHDLMMFPLSIYMLTKGQFIDGGVVDGEFIKVITSLNQNGNYYVGMPIGKAITEYIIHMFADFFSAKGLPVPGSSVLTHFGNKEVREFVNKMYDEGYNFRHFLVQGIPVLVTEIIIRIYMGCRYFKSNEYSKEARIHKRNKLLLITHSIATCINIGKVIITKNPTSLNLPMILRVIQLVWKVVKEEISISHKAVLKSNLVVEKTQLMELQTLVLLDKAVYYTEEINRFYDSRKNDFYEALRKNEEADVEQENRLLYLLDELNKINSLGDEIE